MDSAGWMRAQDVVAELQSVGYAPYSIASVTDLLVIVVTGPKGRLQIGIWTGGVDRLDVTHVFIRANQGHTIDFVREDRVAKVKLSLDELVPCIRNIWHATKWEHMSNILKEGLIPGGQRRGRNSVYLSPLEPWGQRLQGGRA